MRRRTAVSIAGVTILGLALAGFVTDSDTAAATPMFRLHDIGLSLGMTESEARESLGDKFVLQGQPADEPRIDPPRYSKAYWLRQGGGIVGEIVFGNDGKLVRISANVFEGTAMTPQELTRALAVVLADFAGEGETIEAVSNKGRRRPHNSQISFTAGDRTLKLTVSDYDPEASQRVTLVESIGEI